MALQLFDLLKDGYFPKELPPPFNTTEYAISVAGPSTTISSSVFLSKPMFSMFCVHNLARTGELRRNLGIPNPKHFYRLGKHLVQYWNQLETFTHASPFSLTKPKDGSSDRAIMPEHELKERILFRAKIRSNARFVLMADISRFFPSIYSHSFPWALIGKAAAKAAHNNRTLRGRWEDKIDLYSRSIANNQTIGIPIGPDTSRLLAEVILSPIDVELAKQFKHIKGIRYIDDYEFATATRFEAEEILSTLQQLLSQFELALNPNKTKIVELPYEFETHWVSRIRVFQFRNKGITGQKNDISAYFDVVFAFFKRFPGEGLMKYAIARLGSEKIKKENWSFFESTLQQCVLIEPACIPQVCDQILYYQAKHYKIDKPLWSQCLNRIVIERVPLGYSSEAAWAMWLMKILKIRLLQKSAKIVGSCEDSVVGLMGLGLAALGLTKFNYLSELNRFHSLSGLFEEQWLLCYQGNLMSWLGPNSSRSNLQNDQLFSHLEANNVSFFDIGIQPPTPIRYSRSTSYFGSSGGY